MNISSELLKTWLSIRYNPTETTFYGKPKANLPRRLTIAEFKQPKLTEPFRSLANRLTYVVDKIILRYAKEDKIGILGGGGIDSTVILASLLCFEAEPTLITLGFGEPEDEIESAALTAEYFDVPHKWKISTNCLKNTAQANKCLDEPTRHACENYEIVKFAKECGCQIVFDGLGIDELFGGYYWRYENTQRLGGDIQAYLTGANQYDYLPSDHRFWGEELKAVMVDWPRMFPDFNADLPLFSKVSLTDYNAKCRMNFMPVSRIGSDLGVKIIQPWLTDEFIDFALQVPDEYKYWRGMTKLLFKEAFKDLVPIHSLLKKKQGFGAAPASNTVMRQLRQHSDKILDGWLVDNGYVNDMYYEEALRCNKPTPTQTNKLWDAYTFEVWLRERGG